MGQDSHHEDVWNYSALRVCVDSWFKSHRQLTQENNRVGGGGGVHGLG